MDDTSGRERAIQAEAARRAVQLVMNVDLADPDSRAQARAVTDALGSSGVSEARSRMLDRQILALAEADSGGDQVTADLARLARKARELEGSVSTRRRGVLGRLFGAAPRPERLGTTLDELDAITASLTSSAEILRQNSIALDGYEADIAAESERVAAAVEWADALQTALTAAVAYARSDGTEVERVRFVERELLYPLEGHRQHLRSLLAVNQQAAMSLALMRETNSLLLSHVRQITVVTRHSLALGRVLRHRGSGQGSTATRDAVGTEQGAPSLEEAGTPSSLEALEQSLEELFQALEVHDAWNSEVTAKTQEAVVELRDLTAEVFEAHEHGVSS